MADTAPGKGRFIFTTTVSTGGYEEAEASERVCVHMCGCQPPQAQVRMERTPGESGSSF